MKNFYPELPIVPYQRTTIALTSVVAYIKSMTASKEIKAAIYTMFRFESANGSKGINNNYCGVQADSGRWADWFTKDFAGVVSLKENNTYKYRLFIAFKSFEGCINMLADRVEKRGLYIGGNTNKIVKMEVTTPHKFVTAYKRDWVTGNPNYQPTIKEYNDIGSTYEKGLKLFS
jgi:hypothetical protein